MFYIRKLLAIWAAKAAIKASKLLGKKGSATPGGIALKICPGLLKDLSSQVKKEILVVCGTNGKTTTNNMLYSLITNEGHTSVCNKVGANMMEGVTTAFVDSTSLFGKLEADYACIEMDEASTVKIFDHLTPSKIVVTNLFRDQLDRYGEIDITISLLEQAFDKVPHAQLILNGDDPLVARFGFESKRKCYYYGIDHNLNINLNETKEGRFCTLCGAPLTYHYYHYSQLGDYDCSACAFKRPDLDFRAFDVNLENGLSFTLSFESHTTEFHLNYKGFYNIYNVLAAVSMATLTNIKIEKANDILKGFTPQIGRMESFYLGKPVILNLSKNPAGFNQAISTILQDPREKDVLIVINDNAHDGKDISWIWDVDFERLNSPEIKTFAAAGIRKDDVAVRFKYAELKPFSITADIKSAIIDVVNRKSKVCYVLVNYTALFNTQDILKELEKTGAWQTSGKPILTPAQTPLPPTTDFKLTIGHLYPDLLNLYGDRGNIISLTKRCIWRGIQAEVIEYQLEDDVDFDKLDIVFLGGGSDREQLLVCNKLKEIKDKLYTYVENDGVVIAICGGYQLLGHSYKLQDETIDGLSILDIYTEAGEKRLIGNVVVSAKNLDLDTHIVGFENHAGKTFINEHMPLGEVIYGYGNNGSDAKEGVILKNVIGTYLHGPLLPKNPALTDLIITRALKRTYPDTFEALEPLDDTLEQTANEYIVKRFGK